LRSAKTMAIYLPVEPLYRSGTGPGYIISLPENPDMSAINKINKIFELTGGRAAAIITDTSGDPAHFHVI